MKKLLFLLVLITPSLAKAQAFATGALGEKQSGMGGAGSALAMDASTAGFNPASMSFLKGNSINAGMGVAATKTAYLDSNNFSLSKSKSDMGTPFHIYAVFGAKDSSSLLGKFKFGIAVNTPYGGNVRWDSDWTGRNSIIEKKLSSIAISPNVSFKINEKISIGAGFGYSMSFLHVVSGLPVGTSAQNAAGTDAKVTMDYKSSGWGFGGGVYLKPTEKLSVSLGYMSQSNSKSNSGTVKFENVPGSIANTFPNGKTTTKSSVPQIISVGVAYLVTDKLTVVADYAYGVWSCFKTTEFVFTDTTATSSVKSISIPNNYKNASSVRIGAQYKVTDNFTARVGAGYDQTPIPKDYVYAELPDANRMNYTAGVSYIFNKKFSIDASYRFIDVMKRGSRNVYAQMSGTYKTYGQVFGLSLNYNF